MLSDDYNNGVEEPEDEVVSYKTETDQESIRTDSRASEVSSVNSVLQASTSILQNSPLINGIDKVANTGADVLGHSVIVREHDESSSSTYDEDMKVETHSGINPQRKSLSCSKKIKGKRNLPAAKQNKDESNSSLTSSKMDRRKGRQCSNAKGNNKGSPSDEEQLLKLVLIDDTKEDSHYLQDNSKQEMKKVRGKEMVHTKSPDTHTSQLQSGPKDQKNLAMSPTVIIKELNLKHKDIKKKFTSSPKNKALTNKGSPSEKFTTQKTINAYFSPPTKKSVEKALAVDANKSAYVKTFKKCEEAILKDKKPEMVTPDQESLKDSPKFSGATSNSSNNDEVSKEKIFGTMRSEQKLSHIEKDISNKDTSNYQSRKRSLRAKTENRSNTDYGASTNTPYDSADSEISEVESVKSDETGNNEDDANSRMEAPFIISKRGRKIGRPRYIYESSSEHTSEAESSRTASPAIGKFRGN